MIICESYILLREKVYTFLKLIGIEVEVRQYVKGFLNHTSIENGVLVVDNEAKINDILHEVGHLATLPARFRKYASGNIKFIHEKMFEEVDFSNPDAPEARAAMQCSDTEATAWAWAAGVYLEIHPQIIIEDGDYNSEGSSLRFALKANSYLGINGLSAAGFCAVNRMCSVAFNKPIYPQLAKWLQD